MVERLAYDPWGKRRFASGATTGNPDTLDAITGLTIDRGFTMHEHIDEMGIINMNGRIYDPLIGRFMSADPYIQAPDDLQSHNRYAYVMNNPLNLDDPSGYWSISKMWKKVWKSPIFNALVGIAVAVIAPGLLTYLAPSLFGASSLATAVATGALSGFASTGTLKGALTGAFTAGIMFGVGEIAGALKDAGVGGFENGGLGKIALHAGAGCISSVAGGGECKTGALSGGLGEFGHNIPDGGNWAIGTVKAAMLGGIGSKIGGGKFADGASTGAFGYIFNHGWHSKVFDPVRDFFNKGAENLTSAGKTAGLILDVGADAVAACGVVNPHCRAVDAVIGAGKAGYSLIANNDGKEAIGVGVGTASEKIINSTLTVANAASIPGSRIPTAVGKGVAYVTGKVNEYLWMNPPNQQNTQTQK